MVGDLKIDYCNECRMWVYVYNDQKCPVCRDRIEKERLEHEKQLERLSGHGQLVSKISWRIRILSTLKTERDVAVVYEWY